MDQPVKTHTLRVHRTANHQLETTLKLIRLAHDSGSGNRAQTTTLQAVNFYTSASQAAQAQPGPLSRLNHDWISRHKRYCANHFHSGQTQMSRTPGTNQGVASLDRQRPAERVSKGGVVPIYTGKTYNW